jgi:hypothetical protein
MRTWLRSVVDTVLGRVSGKTSRPDTATRMAMDADFSYRREPMPQGELVESERDDGHLVKGGMLADVDFLKELIRIVNEAHGRDAEDELRLYRPMSGAWPSPSQRKPLDPGSRF